MSKNLGQREQDRRTQQGWRARGYTRVPNILTSLALPPGVRLTAISLYSVAFGARSGICRTTESLAKVRGLSRQSMHRHLKVLEAAHLIRRIRRGKRLANIIILTLKEGAALLSAAIERCIPYLAPALFGKARLPMGWWLARWKEFAALRRPLPTWGIALG